MLASLSDVSTKHRQGGLFIASQTTDFGTITYNTTMGENVKQVGYPLRIIERVQPVLSTTAIGCDSLFIINAHVEQKFFHHRFSSNKG